MSKTTTVSSGISTTGLLGVVFVTLKLCHVIDWSWWWVTCPFWGPVVLVLGIMAAIGAGLLVALLFATIVDAIVK